MAHELRRTTIAAVAAGLLAALGVTLTFQLLLHPAESASCNTSLLPSAYRTALVPVHLAAAALLSGCLLALGAQRRVLAAVWAYALACVIEAALFGPVAVFAVFAGPLIGPILVLVLGVRAVAIRRSPRSREALWRDHARSARVLLWAGLVLGVPSSLAYSWLNGANPFCF